MNNFVRIAMATGVVDVIENTKNKDGFDLMGSLNSVATLANALAQSKNARVIRDKNFDL